MPPPDRNSGMGAPYVLAMKLAIGGHRWLMLCRAALRLIALNALDALMRRIASVSTLKYRDCTELMRHNSSSNVGRDTCDNSLGDDPAIARS